MSAIHGDDPGLLIAFEGLDGSGKTTQRKLLTAWLEANGKDVVVSKWNSSPLFKDLIKARKASRRLDPVQYSILQAADFRHRFEIVIEPALREGKIVLADRYFFTGIARDVARGLDRPRIAKLYSGVRMPDLAFYFSADPYTLAKRITTSREIKFYEAGQDVTLLDDPFESYVQFAPRVMREYLNLHREFGFITVDAEQSIRAQHRFIRQTYEEYLTDLSDNFPGERFRAPAAYEGHD
jgi:dTMP kinase